MSMYAALINVMICCGILYEAKILKVSPCESNQRFFGSR